MSNLPTGTVTLLFTDIEGSTRLLQQLGDRYASVLEDCRQLIRTAIARWNGHEVDTQGDSFFVVFARANDALLAALDIQRTLKHHSWEKGVTVRVRIGMHTGEPQMSQDNYIGVDIHHAARIMSAAHGGQVLLSQTTRELVEQTLPEGVYLRDLGEHRLKDLRRPSHLFQLGSDDLSTDFPPLKTLDTHPNNLPIEPTQFIGREKEVAAVIELLRRPEVRLLTLTGPAGVGKTRLGLQVAAELSDMFAGGVFLVPLAPVSDPEQVVPIIAQTLGIGEASDQPLLLLLQSALQQKRMLIVLDNFEQVAIAALQIAELLAACRQIKILVTSRVVLRVRAEREYAVPALSLPDNKRLLDPAALSQFEAVALFIERARAVKPDFAVNNTNASAVVDICARLDGLPLAIELAAARIKYFPPQTLLTRLKQGLSVLAGGAHDLPARQQTLRGAIAWSYDLLSPGEQRLFRRLAIFVDGCTWEAAEQVCMAAGELTIDLLEGLTSLVDKSLLRQEEQAEGEARFWTLQTLREFGLERLNSEGEAEITREMHAQYFLQFSEQVEPLLRGAEQSRWLDRLEQEHENLRFALSWLLEWARVETGKQQAEQALRFCTALVWFWYLRGFSREGKSFLDRALMQREGVAASVRAKALCGAAQLAVFVDDYDRAEELVNESLVLNREMEDTAGLAVSLNLSGVIAWARSQYAVARVQLEEAEVLYQQESDAWGQARCLTQLARISSIQGDYGRARILFEKSRVLYQTLGDKERIGWLNYLLAQMLFVSKSDLEHTHTLAEQALSLLKNVGYNQVTAYALNLMGQIHLVQGEQELARELIEESVALNKEVGDRAATAESLMSLARVLTSQGDQDLARHLYEESFQLLQEIHDREYFPLCLESLAGVIAGQGEQERAACLWGAAEVLRETVGNPIPPLYVLEYQQAVAVTREQLGEEAFASAWARGRAMTPEQVLINQNS